MAFSRSEQVSEAVQRGFVGHTKVREIAGLPDDLIRKINCLALFEMRSRDRTSLRGGQRVLWAPQGASNQWIVCAGHHPYDQLLFMIFEMAFRASDQVQRRLKRVLGQYQGSEIPRFILGAPFIWR